MKFIKIDKTNSNAKFAYHRQIINYLILLLIVNNA